MVRTGARRRRRSAAILVNWWPGHTVVGVLRRGFFDAVVLVGEKTAASLAGGGDHEFWMRCLP